MRPEYCETRVPFKLARWLKVRAPAYPTFPAFVYNFILVIKYSRLGYSYTKEGRVGKGNAQCYERKRIDRGPLIVGSNSLAYNDKQGDGGAKTQPGSTSATNIQVSKVRGSISPY
jgi:hypothetical protein